MSDVRFIVTPSSISLVLSGKTYNIQNDHPNYEQIKTALRTKKFDDLIGLIDVAKVVRDFGQGRVTVENGLVKFNGDTVRGTIVDRIMMMIKEGFDVNPLAKFLDRLMNNPSKRAVDGLYDFLEKTSLPITDDGRFVAYKIVGADYMDLYSRTMRNAPGDTLTVARNTVDENPDRTCSHGLHVCSESYLPHYGDVGGGNRVVLCLVDPADVVAIPKDYNAAKMRVCSYVVSEDVTDAVKVDKTTRTVVQTPTFQSVKTTKTDNITVQEAARILGITEGAVRKRADRGVSVEWSVDNFSNVTII